jgi:soluble lytic murein transglycosylase-like protein
MPVASKSNNAQALSLASPRLPLDFHWRVRFFLVPAFILSLAALGFLGILCVTGSSYEGWEPPPLVRPFLPPSPVSITKKAQNTPNYELSPLEKRQADFWPLVRNISDEYKMDPALVMALIQVESNFKPDAISRKGAMGLMQIVPETAQELGLTDPWDPKANLEAGIRYLAKIKDIFDHDLELTLAAYNAGLTKVLTLRAVPDHQETHRYIDQVLDFTDQFRDRFLRMAQN